MMKRRHNYNILSPRSLSLVSCVSLVWMTTASLSSWSSFLVVQVQALQPPLLGLGSLLFPVRGRVIESLANDVAPFTGGSVSSSEAKRRALQQASDFFVDSFWTAKVGGGTRQLTDRQRRELQQSQLAEFSKRYGSNSKSRRADLLLCRVNNKNNKKKNSYDDDNDVDDYYNYNYNYNYNHNNNNIVACAGVEVDSIPDGSLRGPIVARAPVMSNLAVGRQYRRRGLAEAMVQAVERLVRDDWAYDACYLYVEQRNRGAMELYQKLGYRALWQDASATTLMPTPTGELTTTRTVIVCMKKNLSSSRSLFQTLFS